MIDAELQEIDSCPLCGALPCDWVSNPHKQEYLLLSVLSDIRQKTGLGVKPMLTELAEAIATSQRDALVSYRVQSVEVEKLHGRINKLEAALRLAREALFDYHRSYAALLQIDEVFK